MLPKQNIDTVEDQTGKDGDRDISNRGNIKNNENH